MKFVRYFLGINLLLKRGSFACYWGKGLHTTDHTAEKLKKSLMENFIQDSSKIL